MLIAHLTQRRLEREAASLTRRRRMAQSPCGPRQRVSAADGSVREYLGFCSNDYLGLARHPRLVEALVRGAQHWGVGSGASHLVSGHSRAHAELELRLARMMACSIPGAEALLFCSGYMANLAVLTTLGDGQAAIFADKLNHASLIDGGLLATARMRRYVHGRTDQLESMLRDCSTPIRLIVTDAVFSMDGDLAPLVELLALAERHDAWLIVDDAHGFGVLGACGRGSLSHLGLCSERIIYMGTLGKAAGVAGAFVAAHPAIIDALVQGARSYIYTTALPSALALALAASLDVIEGEDGEHRRAQLYARVAQLRERLAGIISRHPDCGWRLSASETAIQALIVGANARALALAAALEAQGLWVPAIRPPTVPSGTARLRITLSAAHSAAEVEQLCAALEVLARQGASE